MFSVLILGFLAGLLAANGAVHFVRGITGHKYPTPFSKPGSAVENVAWGWLNFVAAVLLWHLAPMRHHPRAAFLAVAIGLLFASVALADRGSKYAAKTK